MSHRRQHSLSGPWLRYAFGAALVFVILVGAGREVVNGDAKLILTLIGVVAFCALAATQRGACVGLLVLAAMNGIPFINTSGSVVHHIALQDLACLALIGTALAWTLAGTRDAAPAGLSAILSWCGMALLAWCVLIVGRTWADGQAPLLGAIRFGRDFLYFGALLIVLPRVRLSTRDIQTLTVVLCAGVCLFAAGQIVIAEGIADPTWLVHAGGSAKTLGVTRLFAQMTDLVTAGVAFGIAAVALKRGRAQSKVIPVTLLLVTSFVLQLTRARWLALIPSVIFVSLWLALQADRRIALRLRRRLAITALAATAAVLILLTVGSGLISTGPLVQRVLSIFTDVGSSTSTVAVRQHVANEMATLLGGHWLTGLGLIPPSAHYYPPFPSGSIRDPDVGVLNAVMTVGVVGAALIYLPLLVTLAYCLRTARDSVALRFPWLSYGGQIWIVTTVASSITLVTLFSPSGLVLSAVILAGLSQASAHRVKDPPDELSEPDRSIAPPSLVPV